MPVRVGIFARDDPRRAGRRNSGMQLQQPPRFDDAHVRFSLLLNDIVCVFAQVAWMRSVEVKVSNQESSVCKLWCGGRLPLDLCRLFEWLWRNVELV